MNKIRNEMLSYILTKIPKEFRGKESWLGVKMSPHTHMVFINKIQEDGIETNEGFYDWEGCSNSIISTIYQRLKANDSNSVTN